MFSRKASVLSPILFVFTTMALAGDAIPNWAAPAWWTPSRSGSSSGVKVLGETNPLPFIAITPPCRGADTRGNGFTGQYGPPFLAGGSVRSFTIVGTCGIPASAAAVSFNFTVTNDPTFGDLRIFPAGASAVVSTLNWGPGTGNLANAAVVQLGTGGAITIQVDGPGPVDLIYDINGYYASTSASNPLASGEQFNLFGSVSGTGTGVLHVRNLEAASPARAAYITADSAGTGSSAIGAFETATTGLTTGIFSRANSSTDSSSGLSAFEGATSGKVFGVLAQTGSTSNGAAGVKAIGGSGESAGSGLQGSPGVIGTAKTAAGVGGLSQTRAVVGILWDASGSFLAEGDLASNLGGSSFYGVYSIGNMGASGTKPFVEVHPTDPSKTIRYVALEGPEAGTYFRGRGRFLDGWARIPVPESFRLVTDGDGLTVQITPIGEMASYAVTQVGLDEIIVRGSKDVEFFYTVNGVRQTFKDWEVIADTGEYTPRSADARMPQAFSPEQRRRLIANGTYNPDGTVNRETAARLGWERAWAERERAAAEVGKIPN